MHSPPLSAFAMGHCGSRLGRKQTEREVGSEGVVACLGPSWHEGEWVEGLVIDMWTGAG